MIIELMTLDKIDPQQLAYHANDIRVSRYLKKSFPFPYTLDHALSFIHSSLENHNIDFGIVVDGVCVGCIGTTFFDDVYERNAEIGYWIHPNYWNKGIMSQVLPSVCFHLFKYYNIHKIYAIAFNDNKSSLHLLTKCGFIKEGYFKDYIFKDNQYFDAVFFSLLEDSYND